MKSFSINRIVYSGTVNIKSFLKDPYITQFSNSFTVKSGCYLLLGNPKVYGPGTNFTISPKNFKKVLNTIEMAIHWFYDPGKKDMFFIDENNQKQFNLDYQKLKISVKNKNNGTCIVFSPCLVDGYNGVEEGVCLYINEPANNVGITLTELKELFSSLSCFGFQSETILLMQALDFNLKNNRIISRDEESIHRTIEGTDRAFGSR